MEQRFFEVEFFQVVDGQEVFSRMTVRASDEFEAVQEVEFSRTAAGAFKSVHFVHEVDGF